MASSHVGERRVDVVDEGTKVRFPAGGRVPRRSPKQITFGNITVGIRRARPGDAWLVYAPELEILRGNGGLDEQLVTLGGGPFQHGIPALRNGRPRLECSFR